MKHSSRRGKEIEHGTIDSTGADSEAFQFGYFYRTVEDSVNAYAAQAGSQDSFSDIAARVSALLEAASVRERLGNPQLVPEVRQNSSGNSGGRPARLQANEYGTAENLYVRARGGSPLKRKMSAAGRAAISQAQRARWAKVRGGERTLTGKQLRAMRRNAKLARAARAKKPGKGMSAETKAKISEARKLYWKERKKLEAAAERDE